MLLEKKGRHKLFSSHCLRYFIFVYFIVDAAGEEGEKKKIIIRDGNRSGIDGIHVIDIRYVYDIRDK